MTTIEKKPNFFQDFVIFKHKINLEIFDKIKTKFPDVTRQMSFGITYENKFRVAIEESRNWHYKIDFIVDLDGENLELLRNTWWRKEEADEITQFAVQTIKNYYPTFKEITNEYLSSLDKNIEPDYNTLKNLREQLEETEVKLWDNLPKWLKHKAVSYQGITLYYKSTPIVNIKENDSEILKGIGFLYDFINKKNPITFEGFLENLKSFLHTLIETDLFKKYQKTFDQYKHLSKIFTEKYCEIYSYYNYILKFKEFYGH